MTESETILALAELYINLRVKDLGKVRSFHPTKANKIKRTKEALKEVEDIINCKLEIVL